MEERAAREEKQRQLEARVNSYLSENPDVIFREYLQTLKSRIWEQNIQTELLQDELDRSRQMYLRRVELNAQRRQGMTNKEEHIAETDSAAETTGNVETADNAKPDGVETINNTETQGNVMSDTQAAQSSLPEQKSQYIEYREVPSPKPAARNFSGSGEFMVGAAILSVVGGTFILTAFVMLGIYFMNGFVKGMCLYAGALLLMLVSEGLIHRRWPKLATVFTSISIGGLYLFTVINYLSLHNFDMQVAVLITLLITVFATWLSRRRESLTYRILALIASYLCLLTVNREITSAEVLALTGIILLINILCIVLPLRSRQTVFRAVHMCANLLFALTMERRLRVCAVAVEYRMFFVIGLILIMQLLLLVQMRDQDRAERAGSKVDSTALKAFYWIGVIIYGEMLGGMLRNVGVGSVRYISLGAVGFICLAAVIVLRKTSVTWYPYYFANFAALCVAVTAENGWEPVICLVTLLTVAKVLSLRRIAALRLGDGILTTLTCIALLFSVNASQGYGYVLLAAVVLSIFFINHWQTYYEVLLVYTLCFYAALQLEGMLRLPVFVGLLFVGILLFHNVPRFRGKSIMVYNGLALAGELVCFLLLTNPVYRNAYITYLCMLIFGLATIVLTFQEKYQMNFKGKHLVLAVFLTYMALIVKVKLPVANSILLMLIALVCVGMGFYAKEKAVRIYGLVLSLLVCCKILLYDYRGAATLQKIILFFTVGVIALIIAGIYIILEKKNSKGL